MLRDFGLVDFPYAQFAMLIPATTEGRVQRILIYPGTPVKADSVVMILTSQELETDLLNAEYALKAAEADYGVALDPVDFGIDATRTAQLRRETAGS